MAETALYLKAMGGQDKETKTRYVQILFSELRFLSEDSYVFLMLTQTTGKERVPFNEGRKKSTRTITFEDLGQIAAKSAAAS